MIPGGTHGHMHAVLDGLTPHTAVLAVSREFPGWHVRETACGVWADTTTSPMPGRVDVRAPDAEHMWQELADCEWHWFTAAIAPHSHQGGTP